MVFGQRAPFDFSPPTIWDAGTGAGHTAFFLIRKYPCARLLGTDLDSEMIRRCRVIAARTQNARVEFCEEDLVQTARRPEYDLVICFEVLEHIEDYDTAVHNLSSSLSAGGILIIHTPAKGRFNGEEGGRFGLRRFGEKPPSPVSREKGQYHVHPGFEIGQLEECLTRHGLMVERSEFTFGVLAMFAHTIYEKTRSRSLCMLLSFPFLMLMGLIDWFLHRKEGGGILVVARKPNVIPDCQ
ncbi:MAG: class I SAM-dependent methyltransferase [Chloroflexi bacterium]|nr:class I SAM-dependent methyltransferase [Chloroflexota bacterium]